MTDLPKKQEIFSVWERKEWVWEKMAEQIEKMDGKYWEIGEDGRKRRFIYIF